MDQAELDRIRQRFDEEVRSRIPGQAIQRVELLQYGDDPEIEPGNLLLRVVIEAPDDKDERMHAFEDFAHTRREAFRELRKELDKLPAPAMLQFVAGGEPPEGGPQGPRFQLVHARGGTGENCETVPALTPVMTRVGPEDLETLDTLIAAGIATSRAEAVRWALARIRERPAYEQLRTRTREIDQLKSQF
jgi:hypothetical protein